MQNPQFCVQKIAELLQKDGFTWGMVSPPCNTMNYLFIILNRLAMAVPFLAFPGGLLFLCAMLGCLAAPPGSAFASVTLSVYGLNNPLLDGGTCVSGGVKSSLNSRLFWQGTTR